ncbi:MAG: TlpA family protein disulfide reductase [Aquificaceae bacterium]|nr:TlpA family protein disulfide reductase [Aquificaceae bacterium]MCX8164716.1 TlpA family protein disulfide reductase [Aquificaceae bacterium]
MFRYLPYLLAGLLLGIMLFFGLKQKQEEVLQALPSSEQSMPNLTFRTTDGKVFRLSDLRGKVVLVNFWATWCPPCKEELPLFEREYRRCRDRGFEVLAVNMDSSETSLERFLRENSYSFWMVRTSEEAEKELKLMGFPTSYLLDRDGKVYRVKLGVYRDLSKDLKELLGC